MRKPSLFCTETNLRDDKFIATGTWVGVGLLALIEDKVLDLNFVVECSHVDFSTSAEAVTCSESSQASRQMEIENLAEGGSWRLHLQMADNCN
jgi:hypothetical protein